MLSHPGIPLFRRRYGAAALTSLALPATIKHHDLHHHALHHQAGIAVFICIECQHYFIRRNTFLDHMTTDAAHAETSAAAMDEIGEYPFEDALALSHARFLVLGVGADPIQPPPPPQQQLHRRLMVNFTHPYLASHYTIRIDDGTCTIAALQRLLQLPYDGPIAWGPLWAAGLVVRCTVRGGDARRVLVKVDEDVKELVEMLDYGECWVGDERR